MKEKIAVFPGSFDPLTLGHQDIVVRGLHIFDRIIIGVGSNSQKTNMFPVEKRTGWIRDVFKGNSRISVETYEGLTVEFCKKNNAGYILRGLRTSADFEFEKAIAHMNAAISENIESVFVLSDLRFAALSSSIVRDIIRNGGDARQFVPDAVKNDL